MSRCPMLLLDPLDTHNGAHLNLYAMLYSLSQTSCLRSTYAASADSTRSARRHISGGVLHDSPNAPKSIHPALLVEKIVPLRALQARTAPIFLSGRRLRQDSCGQVMCISVVDGEFEDADVVE